MFADDTNLFYSHKNLKTLFNIVNIELNKLNNWFKSNKLSLNTGKTKYTFFHKLNLSENIPLQLPELKIHKGGFTSVQYIVRNIEQYIVNNCAQYIVVCKRFSQYIVDKY